MSPSSPKLRRTETHGNVGKVLSKNELEAAHCWEADDRVPRRPEMTDFRRNLRYHQSQWREAHGHPIGSQPIAPKPNGRARLVGSRLPLAYARETGANFLTRGALDAAKARTSAKEPHQSVDVQRSWARSAVVGDDVVQPLWGSRGGSRTRRSRGPHLVAGCAGHGARRPLRAFPGVARSRVHRKPHVV